MDRLAHADPQALADNSVHVRRALSPTREPKTEVSKMIEKDQLAAFCLSLANRRAGSTGEGYQALLAVAAQLEGSRSEWEAETYEEWLTWRSVPFGLCSARTACRSCSMWWHPSRSLRSCALDADLTALVVAGISSAHMKGEQQWRRDILRGQVSTAVEARYWPEDASLLSELREKSEELLPGIQSSSSSALERNKVLCGIMDGSAGDDSVVSQGTLSQPDDLLHEQMHLALAASPAAQLRLMQYLANTATRYRWDEAGHRRRAFRPQQYVLRVVSASGLLKVPRPFDAGCLPLSYSGNPRVNDESHRGCLLKADIFDGSDPFVRIQWNGQLVGQTPVGKQAFPFTGCVPLSCSSDPGVNGVSDMGNARGSGQHPQPEMGPPRPAARAPGAAQHAQAGDV